MRGWQQSAKRENILTLMKSFLRTSSLIFCSKIEWSNGLLAIICMSGNAKQPHYNATHCGDFCSSWTSKLTSPSFTRKKELWAPDWTSTAIRGVLNPRRGWFCGSNHWKILPRVTKGGTTNVRSNRIIIPGLLLYCVMTTRQSVGPRVNCVSISCLILLDSPRRSVHCLHHNLVQKSWIWLHNNISYSCAVCVCMHEYSSEQGGRRVPWCH